MVASHCVLERDSRIVSDRHVVRMPLAVKRFALNCAGMVGLKHVVIPALVGSAAIAVVPHASADVPARAVPPLTPATFNANEQAFLRELQHDQIPVNDELSAVDLGHAICGEFQQGYGENRVQADISSGAPQLEGVTGSIMMDAAVTYLCPSEEDGRPGLGLPRDMQHGWG
jgi:hypothetical protein